MTVPVKKTLQTYHITHASRYNQQIRHYLFTVKQENEHRFKKINTFNVYHIVFSDTPEAAASTVQFSGTAP